MRKKNQDSENRKAMEVINRLYDYLLKDTARAAVEKQDASTTTAAYYSGMNSECMIMFDRLNEIRKELEKGHF